MRARVVAIVFMTLGVLLLAGCFPTGSSEGSSPEKTKETTTSPSPIPSDVPQDTTGDAGGGAKAGPDVSGDASSNGIVDASQKAYEDFYTWWQYEVQTPQDWSVSYDKTVYPMGVIACTKLALGNSPTSVATYLTNNYSLTGSGAQGVVVGAQNALCPKYGTGYRSYFDHNAQAFMSTLTPKLTFKVAPTIFDYGRYMREACWYLSYVGKPSTLFDHMQALGAQGGLFVVGAQANDARVPRILMQQAVLSGCVGYFNSLPPVIINS
jgi:hypothetical protein